MKIKYEVRNMTSSKALEKALGSRKENIAPDSKSKNPKALYHKLNELLKSKEYESYNVSIKDIIQGAQVSNKLENEIWKLLDDKDIGYNVNKYKLKATIHKKKAIRMLH